MELSVKLMQQDFGRRLGLNIQQSEHIEFYFYFINEDLLLCPHYNEHTFYKCGLPIAKFDFANRKIKPTDHILTHGFSEEYVEYIKFDIQNIRNENELKITIASLTKLFCRERLILISLKSSF